MKAYISLGMKLCETLDKHFFFVPTKKCGSWRLILKHSLLHRTITVIKRNIPTENAVKVFSFLIRCSLCKRRMVLKETTSYLFFFALSYSIQAFSHFQIHGLGLIIDKPKFKDVLVASWKRNKKMTKSGLVKCEKWKLFSLEIKTT